MKAVKLCTRSVSEIYFACHWDVKHLRNNSILDNNNNNNANERISRAPFHVKHAQLR